MKSLIQDLSPLNRKEVCTRSINPSQVNHCECSDINMEDKRISFCIFFSISITKSFPSLCNFIMSPITWIRIWLRNICFILAGIELASREPNSFHSTPIHLVFLCIRHNAGHKHDPDTFPECKNLGHWEFSEAWVCGNLTLPGKAWNQIVTKSRYWISH